MDRVGIVVPRFGDEVVGGTETLARHLAKLLARSYEVHIITTTIRAFGSDERFYRSGESEIAPNIKLFRFEPDHKQWYYASDQDPWTYYEIPNPKMIDDNLDPKYLEELQNTPVQLCERFISDHGPYSTRLQEFLLENHKNYKKVIFSPYLHATTYYGIDCIGHKQSAVLMAAHYEPYLFMPCMRKYSQVEKWLYTGPESTLLDRAGIDTTNRRFVLPPIVFEQKVRNAEYDKNLIIFSGRASFGKGFDRLASMVANIRSKGTPLRIKVLGEADPQTTALIGANRDWIHCTGHLSEDARLNEMSGALCLVNPSRLDSFGLVNIESYMAGTPALLDLNCPAYKQLAPQFKFLGYSNPAQFEERIEELQTETRAIAVDMATTELSESFSDDKLYALYKSLIEE